MKRAVQAFVATTSLPWGVATTIGSRSSSSTGPIIAGGIGGSDVAGRAALLQFTTLRYSSSTFADAGKSSSLFAFAPPPLLSSKEIKSQHRRSAQNTTTSRMMTSNSNNNSDIQQVKNRIALLQLPVTHDKSKNIETAIDYIKRAHNAGARLCVLPEIWNSPYATSAFPEYAEVLPGIGDSLSSAEEKKKRDGDEMCWGPSSRMLMEMAQSTGMYIVGGSVPERRVKSTSSTSASDPEEKIYNTCLIINPSGTIVGKHRKVHLFDVNVPGGIQFRESETLSAGEGATYFDVKDDEDEGGFGRVGVGICYDIRFPEYALLLTQTHQCKILIYPGAFNLTTGPAHWELLQRARAVDGQCYVLTASPARMPPPDKDAGDDESKYPHYSAWGHSTVISPWGEVVATCEEKPAVVLADLDMKKVEEMRMAIPTMVQKRHDLYRLVGGD